MKKYFPVLTFIIVFCGFLAIQVTLDMFSPSANMSSSEKKINAHYNSLFNSTTINIVSGKKINFKKIEQRVVILAFWATWCAPCVDELLSLKRLIGRVGTEKLKIILINGDEERSLYEINKFIKKHDLEFDMVLDPDGFYHQKYLVKSIPFSLVYVDQKIKSIHAGSFDFSSEEFIEDLLDSLM